MSESPHPFARARRAIKLLPKGLTQGQRNVFNALLMHVDEKGEARPSMKTLANMADMADERSARRAVTALCDVGVVERLEVGGGVIRGKPGKGKASEYRIPEASEAAFSAAEKTRTDESGISNRNPDRTRHKPGLYKPQTRTREPSQVTGSDIEETRAYAREGFSEFLSRGLAALEVHHPAVAANWGPKIVDAEIADGALMVQTTTRHAANFLRTNHGDKLLAAFAPTDGVGRLVVEAIQ